MMGDYRLEYWQDAVGESLCELGLWDRLTPDQRTNLAKDMEAAADAMSTAFGDDVANANWNANNEREKQDLRDLAQRERDKVTCRECNGRGFIRSHGPSHYSDHDCWKCHGAGRHDP